jgi:hypothetical protein
MSLLDHEKVLLGDSFSTILAETQRFIPVISEYQFQREVLDILVNPYNRDALQRYLPYVGELTQPLRVVDNNNRELVLFEVPAFMQSPITTMPTANGYSADSFFNSLGRDIDLGAHRVNDKIVNFMETITVTPDYQAVVVQPIRAILNRYGRDYQLATASNGQLGQPVSINTPAQPTMGTTSFAGDYED